MKITSDCRALIVGPSDKLCEDLKLEIARHGGKAALFGRDPVPEKADLLLYMRGWLPEGPLEERVAAVAGSVGGLKQLCLIDSLRPSLDALIFEDALRYLADQHGAPVATLRPEQLRPASKAAESGPVRVLVTGAAGQIGLAMRRFLDESGVANMGMDIATRPGMDELFLQCDLSDPSQVGRMAEFCRPVTHVIHLAGRITNAKSLAESYPEQFRLNVLGTLNLLKALPPSLRHFSYASSMTVYGEARTELVDESHPLNPNCIYALCKVAVERHLAEFGSRTGAKIAILRYTSAYGPGPASNRAIPGMIARLLSGQAPEVFGEGRARRDYIYVEDLCRATLQATLREAEGVFNIGTGVGITAAELADLLARLIGTGIKPVYIPRSMDSQAVSSLVFDIGKMRRELGFAPQVALEEGLLKTIRHFEAAVPVKAAPAPLVQNAPTIAAAAAPPEAVA